jgi:hypothetical protein
MREILKEVRVIKKVIGALGSFGLSFMAERTFPLVFWMTIGCLFVLAILVQALNDEQD